jgi:Neprosin
MHVSEGWLRYRGTASLIAALVFVGLLAPAGAQAAPYTSPSLYDCQPRDPNMAKPPPPPELPPQVAAQLPEAIASDHLEAVCPEGEVPEPTGAKQFPKEAPTVLDSSTAGNAKASAAGARKIGAGGHRKHDHRVPRATASREPIGGSWYSWALGLQQYSGSKGVNGLWVSQTNEQPYIPSGESELGAHSLGQLWAINNGGNGCFSTVETGWSESVGQFHDANPHLFVYAFDCGVGLGYSSNEYGGIHWVQSSSSVFPNQVLTHNDTFHVYGARMDGNNWWIYYDGQWVGYIPHSVWVYRFPGVITEAEAGGEVATPNKTTCADMGYSGLFGGNPAAAMFGYVWYEYNYQTQSALANLWSYSSDPSYYATGNWTEYNHGYAFRYGGPGWC